MTRNFPVSQTNSSLRRLHHSFRGDAGGGRDASPPPGAGAGSEAESGSCWSLEAGKSSSNLNVKLIQP